MKLFGHPLHMIFIHFPSALLPMDCVCCLLFYVYGGEGFKAASFYAMMGAVAMGWLAIISGAADLAKIPANRPGAIKKAVVHGAVNSTVLIIYSVYAYIAWQGIPQSAGTLLIAKTALVLTMTVGNFVGASLLLKDKIGIQE